MLVGKEVTSQEVTRAVIERIEKVDRKTSAYVAKTFDLALEQARLVDEKIKRGEEISPLAGIPIAVKDNICLKDAPATCSSRILSNFIPPYEATVITKLRKAGALFMGKTNMDEFAMGSSTETSHFGITRNPWNLETIPGGSSGGSAAAVSSEEAILALGSDTGGSIRQPAALCGVVGLKPTYGRVSRFGLVAFASSLDQIGPITKDVTDSALLLNVIGGYDPQDSTSVNSPLPNYTKSLVGGVKGLKIGIPKEYFIEGLDPQVESSVREGIKLLEGLGAEFEEVSLPHTDYAIATYYIIASSEASSNLARYDGVQYGYRVDLGPGTGNSMIDMYRKTRSQGFGPEVKRRIMLGTYALSSGYYDAYYLKAQKVRTLIKEDFDKVFEKFDVLITPTSPTPAFKIGEKVDNPLEMYLSDIFTISANLAGIPGISIPCGFSKGLPLGLQILARPFAEETLFRVAYTFEENTEFHKKKPLLKGD
jgi:aspartyl-tRNA(Asn)/glutamyl-tRNA(Gln) amidotransferase subunit A